MLKAIYKLDFQLELLTGMHIGGSIDSFDIGGADATVIKNPLTHEPYIPGSSLKGKIRSLLTYKYGKEGKDQRGKDALVIVNDTIRSIFEPLEKEKDVCVTRGIFRDASLTKDSADLLQRHLGEGNYTEIKAENKIDLLKGKAETPRFIERVPAGAVFSGEIILQVFDGDNEDALRKYLLEGLQMLEVNYIGGNGTRGYGRVRINTSGFEKVAL